MEISPPPSSVLLQTAVGDGSEKVTIACLLAEVEELKHKGRLMDSVTAIMQPVTAGFLLSEAELAAKTIRIREAVATHARTLAGNGEREGAPPARTLAEIVEARQGVGA